MKWLLVFLSVVFTPSALAMGWGHTASYACIAPSMTVSGGAPRAPQLIYIKDVAYILCQAIPKPHSSVVTVILALACVMVSDRKIKYIK